MPSEYGLFFWLTNDLIKANKIHLSFLRIHANNIDEPHLEFNLIANSSQMVIATQQLVSSLNWKQPFITVENVNNHDSSAAILHLNNKLL